MGVKIFLSLTNQSPFIARGCLFEAYFTRKRHIRRTIKESGYIVRDARDKKKVFIYKEKLV
jgi:hypothetical protein